MLGAYIKGVLILICIKIYINSCYELSLALVIVK